MSYCPGISTEARTAHHRPVEQGGTQLTLTIYRTIVPIDNPERASLVDGKSVDARAIERIRAGRRSLKFDWPKDQEPVTYWGPELLAARRAQPDKVPPGNPGSAQTVDGVLCEFSTQLDGAAFTLARFIPEPGRLRLHQVACNGALLFRARGYRVGLVHGCRLISFVVRLVGTNRPEDHERKLLADFFDLCAIR